MNRLGVSCPPLATLKKDGISWASEILLLPIQTCYVITHISYDCRERTLTPSMGSVNHHYAAHSLEAVKGQVTLRLLPEVGPEQASRQAFD